MAANKFLSYDRFGHYLGELVDISSGTYHTRINGEDTLTLDALVLLTKGDRIVWRYADIWREHVVNESTQEQDDDGAEMCNYVCESSLLHDLNLAHIQTSNKWLNVTPEYALGEILKLTSWEVGTIAVDVETASFEWEHTTVYEALLNIAGNFNCEIVPEIEVDKTGVVRRKVSLFTQCGRMTGLRFEYAHNMSGVRKEVLADEVYTAVYGYGKDTGTGDAAKPLTFSGINGGVPYVADEEAKEHWGLPDGHGGLMHAFGYYENSDCEDAAQLLEETKNFLEQHKAPAINYRVTIPDMVSWGVDKGDVIQVIDREFTPPLRFEARVGEFSEDVVEGVTESVEFGAIRSLVPEVIQRAYQVNRSVVQQVRLATSGINNFESSLAESVTTAKIVLTSGETEGTLTVQPDGLYFNDQKLMLEGGGDVSA